MTVLAPHLAQAAADAADVDVDVLLDAVQIALGGGPDETAPDWISWASCRTEHTDTYFPGRGQDSKHVVEDCKERCAVQAECLGAALAYGEREGVWGGTSSAARLRLRNVLREAGLLGVTGEDAHIAWRESGADHEPPTRLDVRRIRKPWPHQLQAVDAIVDAIRDGGICQIAMATGSGKTWVSFAAAAELQARTVLVLMPSLALVTQSAAAWRADERWADTPMLAVCSDTGGSGLEATTDPDRVSEFAAGGGVVFGTYQSSDVLIASRVCFDLVIADEAHHLAGDADKTFAAIVRGEILCDRTLYMTATPRRFLKKRSGPDVDVVSMDDHAAFGPRVYELSLSDAVDAGVIADYRVVVAAVDRHVFDKIAEHPDMEGVDPHLLAGAIAIVEAMGTMRLTSCVSFHTRVERARSFSRLVGAVADLLPGIRPIRPGWAGYISGDTSVRIRDRLLARLADRTTWGVLANAKALGEGVDLPELDAVAIVDPKNSEVDVLQATGRALRRPTGTTKVGTVLLPVLVDEGAAIDDPMSGIDERSIGLVAGVLRALRTYDTELGGRLDAIRRGNARRSIDPEATPELVYAMRARAARGLLQSRVELHLPGGAVGDLAGAMALHLVREATASWDEAYGRLQAWVAEHGHCRIPQSAEVTMTADTTSTLGQWVSRQRTLHRRGLLATERVDALEKLPGWMWNARDEAWWEKFDVFEEFVRSHGRYPTQFEEWHDVKVGNFLWGIRAGVKPNDDAWLTRFPDRVAAIEALPGWTWDPRAAWWEEHFAQLERWAAANGHAHPSQGDCAEDGFDLGKWTAKERGKIRGGRRTPDQAARLRALPGWVDDFKQVSTDMWEDGFSRCAEWMATNGGMPPQSLRLDDGYRLGTWVAKQRESYRGRRAASTLSPERIARLEALPGWTWIPHDEGWARAFELLERIAPARQTADGELLLPTDDVDGFGLSAWAYNQRRAYAAGELSTERTALLETIPGWVWDARKGRRLASAS